nr:hypothetical protein [Francisella tularensis]
MLNAITNAGLKPYLGFLHQKDLERCR